MALRLISIFFLTILTSDLKSQDVLWATEVLDYSSEKTDMYQSPKNRAIQILGEPSIYPQMGESPCAWEPNGSEYGEDYIKVGFEKAIAIRQVAIVENLNPGAVARIFGYDESGQEYLLYQNPGQKVNDSERFWRVPIEPVNRSLNALKLVINHRISRGRKQFDAIAISDDPTLIEGKINLAKDIPEDLQKENLGPVLNSIYGEVAPIITPDGNTLYFTRSHHPDNIKDSRNNNAEIKQDVWYSNKNAQEKWSSPRNLGRPVNDEDLNAAATASASGDGLFVLNIYNKDGSHQSGLSRSSLSDGKWSFPSEVKIEAYDPRSVADGKPPTTEFAISHDEKVLIMGLSQRPSFGNNDLYVSFKQRNGSYSRPLNMGSVLNSADNEGTPFLSADNKTLYFNSEGHPGYGSADIFMSKRLDDSWTNWSEPLNLGPQINSSRWDAFFTIPASGEYAYMSSDYNSIGREDIFKINLFESIKPEPVVLLSSSVLEVGSDKPLTIPLNIKSNNKEINEKGLKMEFDKSSKTYKIILPVGYKYYLNAKASGFIGASDSIDLSDENTYREINKDLYLTPVRAGNKMILANLIFAQGLYDIQKSSHDELGTLIELMKEYPSMEVLLEGHTDNQGDFTLNVELAKDRVDAVKDYLMEVGGIESVRITTKSWGPIKPISSNSTPETRKKNRRVEFTILKM
ncbi:MAG: outer membrane protein OmpA-like peptidoglycan-associated protein [Algoriphagus sp.]|jgi:outer membrane protein OmpA-like peptidoglycan-associated protein